MAPRHNIPTYPDASGTFGARVRSCKGPSHRIPRNLRLDSYEDLACTSGLVAGSEVVPPMAALMIG